MASAMGLEKEFTFGRDTGRRSESSLVSVRDRPDATTRSRSPELRRIHERVGASALGRLLEAIE